jgi:hypothetical protein
MGCLNCKKKKIIKRYVTRQKTNEEVKQKDIGDNQSIKRKVIDIDKVAMWVIIIWFLLGCYGFYSLIKTLIGVIS